MSGTGNEPTPTEPDEPAIAPVAAEPVAAEPAAAAELVAEAGPAARTAADGYAFAALICAAAGLLLPIVVSLIGGRRGLPSFALVVFTAPAALLLARATEEPVAAEAVSPAVARIAGLAQTFAYASLALVVTFCAALLLGIAGRVIVG